MKNFRIALIGVGARCGGLYRCALKNRQNVEIVALCDTYTDKCERLAQEMEADGKPYPKIYTEYKECIDKEMLDAIVVSAAWEAHLRISIYAMEKGIPVACEVGGAYSIQSLWALVRCYERTQTPIMMMENCCYGRMELLALNMKSKGVLGEIVHCEGGYRHDLREEVSQGEKNRHYRLRQYIHRNCDNYPTHEIGPIAKLLDINCGNRFTSLISIGSKSVGIPTYVKAKGIKELENVRFNQSDIVTTCIECANGETVTITLDTCLPRYYSRGFLVQGTKGLICEENNSVYLEDEFNEEVWEWKEYFNNIEKYYEKYEHPLWQGFKPGREGHGGMDLLVFDAFFDALEHGKPMPIDVYDMATWMSISTLSEQSLATGQKVPFPDFTDGKWTLRENLFEVDAAKQNKNV